MDSNNNNLGVQHDQGEGCQQPITFRRVSQSGQMEIKIQYLYPITNTCNLILNGAWHCSTVGLVNTMDVVKIVNDNI